MSRPDCRGCIFQRELPDSGSHIECLHPKRHREVNHFTAAIAGGDAATNSPRPLNIEGDIAAIEKGWFAWPLNFDPVWIRTCDGEQASIFEADCYYYIHQNGELIRKVGHVVDSGGGPFEYFDSPFVTRWFKGDNVPADIMSKIRDRAQNVE